MGAIISSEPAIDRDNKVSLHRLRRRHAARLDVTPGSTAGQELRASVPNAVLADMGQTTARGYTFKTQLDGTPVIGKTGASSKLLVAGMGAAGRNYYALDVSAPRSRSERPGPGSSGSSPPAAPTATPPRWARRWASPRS